MSAPPSYRVVADHLPELYPTNFHEAAFWEMLGRAVATFGYLEHVLARAIFAFTGTKEYSEEDIRDALAKWIPTLENSLSGTLDRLIGTYAQSVRSHQCGQPEGFEELVADLKEVAQLRNVLCHGFWGKPDGNGATIPMFMRAKDKQIFQSPVDLAYLQQTQLATKDLAVAVVNTVTAMGYQFPGSSGPGKPIM